MIFCVYCEGSFPRSTFYRKHYHGFCVPHPDGWSSHLNTDRRDHPCPYCGEEDLCKWAYRKFHKSSGCVRNGEEGQPAAGSGEAELGGEALQVSQNSQNSSSPVNDTNDDESDIDMGIASSSQSLSDISMGRSSSAYRSHPSSPVSQPSIALYSPPAQATVAVAADEGLANEFFMSELDPDVSDADLEIRLGYFDTDADSDRSEPRSDEDAGFLVAEDEEAWDDIFEPEEDTPIGTDNQWDDPGYSDDWDVVDSLPAQVRAARPGTVQWWKERADDPVLPSNNGQAAATSASVRQVATCLTEAVLRHNVRDTAFEEIIKVFRQLCIPAGSLFPPSKYIMVQLMEPAKLESSMYHLCIGCGDFVWEPLPRDSWKDHFDDVCPREGCQGRRFRLASEGAAGIEPTKCFWYFGLAGTVQHLFTIPEFVQFRGQERDHSRAGFRGSLMADELRRWEEAAQVPLGSRLDCSENSNYDLGFDWVQIFNHIPHSTGVFTVRCADLPDAWKGASQFCLPLAVIPGPEKGCPLKPILRTIFQEFAALGPLGEGLEIAGRQQLRHHVYLTSLCCDAPARSSLGRFLHFNAYRACPWCIWTGQYMNESSKKAIYFSQEPREVSGIGMCSPGDPRLKLSHANFVTRGEAVDRAYQSSEAQGKRAASLYGCHGLPEVCVHLPYVNLRDIWQLPVYHLLILGVCKNILKLTVAKYRGGECPVYAIPYRARKVMQQRLLQIKVPAEFGRPPRDMTTKLGGSTIEDINHWIQVYSPFVLMRPSNHAPWLHPVLLEVLSLMRRIAQHYLGYKIRGDDPCAPGNPYSTENREAAKADIARLASLIQQEYPPSELTYNLHIMRCRLADQEDRRGMVVRENEMWVERVMQVVKCPIKYRLSSHPEKLFVNMFQLRQAVSRMHENHPQLQGLQEVLDQQTRRAKSYDQPEQSDAAFKVQFLGAGKKLSQSDSESILALVMSQVYSEYSEDLEAAGWSDHLILAADVEEFARATIDDNRIYHATNYRRSRSRVDCMGTVEYEGDYAGTWLVEVLRFLKIQTVSEETGEEAVSLVLRLAQCNFFNQHSPVDGMLVAREGDLHDQGYLIFAESLGGKVVVCDRQKSQPRRKFYALQYSTMSRQQ